MPAPPNSTLIEPPPDSTLVEPGRRRRTVFDPAVEEKEVRDAVDIAYRQNIRPDVVNNNYELSKRYDKRERKAKTTVRQYSDSGLLVLGMGAFKDMVPPVEPRHKPVIFDPIQVTKEIGKGPVRFGEYALGFFGGTVFDWLGQFIQAGGAALDKWAKLGSKNPDQIYNPLANAIGAAGQNLEMEGRKGREFWEWQMENNWTRLDPDLAEQDPISYTAGQLSEGVASSALSVLMMYLSGGSSVVSKIPELADRTVKISRGLLVLSGLSAGGAFEHAQSEGESFLWSTIHGLADGGMEYAFEAGVMDDVIQGARPLLIGAKEGLEEFFTGMFQNMRQGILENTNKGMSAYDASKDAAISALRQAPMEVVAGFIGGYGISKGVGLVDLVARRPKIEPEVGAKAPTPVKPTVTPPAEVVAPEAAAKPVAEMTQQEFTVAFGGQGALNPELQKQILDTEGLTVPGLTPREIGVEFVLAGSPLHYAYIKQQVAQPPTPPAVKISEEKRGELRRTEEKRGEIPGGGVDIMSALRNAVKVSNYARKTQVLPKRKETLRKRVGAAAGTLKSLRGKGVAPLEAIWRSTGQLKGEQAPIAVFKPLDEILEPWIVEGAEGQIADNPDLTYFDKIHLTNAEKTGAWDKLKSGQVLTPADVRLIKKWSKDLGKMAEARVPLSVRIFQGLEQFMSLWKIGAGYDVQLRRQARIIRANHPKIYAQAVGKNLKAYVDAAYAEKLAAEVESNPNNADAVAHGVRFLTEADNIEQFAPRVVEKLPIVGRAYTAAIRGFVRSFNWTQQSLWDAGIARWENQGIPITEDMKLDLAEVNNTLLAMTPAKTSFGKALRRVLSPVMWSPTFTWSRIKTPGMLLANPTMRREVAQTLASFIGSGALMLMAAFTIGKLRGDDDVVEADPRSTDFGKIKIKNTRFDIYGDVGPYIRAMVQLITGQKKGQGGRVREKPRFAVIKQFMRNKRAPIFDFLGRIWSGKTFYGGPAFQTPDFLEDTTAGKGAFLIGAEIYQGFMPFFLRATVEAGVIDGWPMGLVAMTEEFFSGQTLTYEPTPYAKMQIRQDAAATMTYGRVWDDLSLSQQDKLRMIDSQIEKLEQTADDERAQWGPPEEISLVEQNEAAENVRRSLSKKAKKVLKDTSVRIPGITRKVGGLWLNNVRYETYQIYAAEEIEKEIEKATKRTSWPRKTPESKQEIVKEIVGVGKLIAADRVLIEIEKGQL